MLEFIGLYLPVSNGNHNQTDSTQWMVAVDSLKQMGWGLAILYVGQQEEDNDTVRKNSKQLGLAHDMTKGVFDASDAIKNMKPFFPKGTTVFLDIESHLDPKSVAPDLRLFPGNPPGLHSDKMVKYATDWVRTLLVDGNYMPGIYCFGGAAEQLRKAFDADPVIKPKLPTAGLRFWVVSENSEKDAAGKRIGISNKQFEKRGDLHPFLNEGFPPAEVWQMLCSGDECLWDPTNLVWRSRSPDTNYRGIVADRNVSTLKDPSAPP